MAPAHPPSFTPDSPVHWKLAVSAGRITVFSGPPMPSERIGLHDDGRLVVRERGGLPVRRGAPKGHDDCSDSHERHHFTSIDSNTCLHHLGSSRATLRYPILSKCRDQVKGPIHAPDRGRPGAHLDRLGRKPARKIPARIASPSPAPGSTSPPDAPTRGSRAQDNGNRPGVPCRPGPRAVRRRPGAIRIPTYGSAPESGAA